MKKFDGWLLVSDLDGTLLNSECSISKENAEAIRRFVAEGGDFTVATGRIPKSACSFIPEIMPTLPIIAQNGMDIYDHKANKALLSIEIGSECDELIDIAYREFPDMAIEMLSGSDIYVSRPSYLTKEHIRIVKFEPIYIDDVRHAPKPWRKVHFWDTDENLKKLIARFDEETKGKQPTYRYMQTLEWLCELFSKEADKWLTLDKMLKIVGKKYKKIVAIGDFDNDAMMVKNADIGFAPSNATELVKDCADIVLAENNNENAVAAAIEILFQEY